MNRPKQIPAWGTEGGLRAETPEERNTNKGIKGKEVEDVRDKLYKLSFIICFKLSLIPEKGSGKGRKRKFF